MKGLVFTELLEFIEATAGEAMADKVLIKADLPNEGAFTSVGSYPHEHLQKIVLAASDEMDESPAHLLQAFGKHLFAQFHRKYPAFFVGSGDAISFLKKIEDLIHPNVYKLYPDAELPRFDIDETESGNLVMTYYSKRKMGDFAHGLILGCLDHFQQSASVSKENLNEDGSVVRFFVEKRA